MASATFAVPPVFEMAATMSTFELAGFASTVHSYIADVAPDTASGGVEEQAMDVIALAQDSAMVNIRIALFFIQSP